MLAAAEIPLIEDDIYGELSFSGQRPGVAKTYDRKGLVLLPRPSPRTSRPSYRVGWVAPGASRTRWMRLKMTTSLGDGILPQLAIAEFLESGGYDHHLRASAAPTPARSSQMAQAVLRYFPAGTRVTSPLGGFVLWVQLPERVDSLELFRARCRRDHPRAGVHLLGHPQVPQLHPPQRGVLVVQRRARAAPAGGIGGGMIAGSK